MKKILLLLGVLLVSNLSAMADCEIYSCVSPYDMNTKFRTVMGAIGGVNSITEKTVETILKKEAEKYVTTDKLKIDIDSYSSKDLKNGIFKSAYAKGENVIINDIHLSELELKTLCEFNYIKQSGNSIVLVEDLPLSFKLAMTQDNINRTMQHQKYKQIVEDLNALGANYAGGLKISSTKVAIKNNKFYYIVGFHIPFFGQEPKIVFQSDVHAKDGKLNYTNTKIVSGNISLDLSKSNFLMNYLNPLSFSVKIFDEKDADIRIEKVSIENNEIIASGVINVKKD
jgi:hypothetical protein